MNLEKIDIGINLLDPTLDKLLDIDTSIIDDNFHTEDILFTLLSIPSDLWGFYTQFAIGVRRGLSSILSSVGLSDLSALVTKPDKPGLTKPSYSAPTFNNNYKPGFSLKAADIVDYIRQKKKTEAFDDPNSPYSVNYKGPSTGHNVEFSGEAPYQSGYFSLKTPSHSHSQSWGQSSSVGGGRNFIKDASLPILPDIHSNNVNSWKDSGSFNVDYDSNGNLLFTDINKHRRYGDKDGDDFGNLNFESDNSVGEVEEGAALPRIKVKKAPELIFDREPAIAGQVDPVFQQPTWVPKKKSTHRTRKKSGGGQYWTKGDKRQTKSKKPGRMPSRRKMAADNRRKRGWSSRREVNDGWTKRTEGKGGGRRFDRVAPNSNERMDVKIVKGEVPDKDYYYVDYFYYD